MTKSDINPDKKSCLGLETMIIQNLKQTGPYTYIGNQNCCNKVCIYTRAVGPGLQMLNIEKILRNLR